MYFIIFLGFCILQIFAFKDLKLFIRGYFVHILVHIKFIKIFTQCLESIHSHYNNAKFSKDFYAFGYHRWWHGRAFGYC